jgi:hypothetical protein
MSSKQYYTDVRRALRGIRERSESSIDEIRTCVIPVTRLVVEMLSKHQKCVDNILQRELDFLLHQFHFHETLIVDTDTTFMVDDSQFQSQTMERQQLLRDSRKETVVLLQANLRSVETDLCNMKQLIVSLKWLYQS